MPSSRAVNGNTEHDSNRGIPSGPANAAPLLTDDDYLALLSAIESLHACASLEDFPQAANLVIASLIEGNLVGYNEVNLEKGSLVVAFHPRPPQLWPELGPAFQQYMGQHPLIVYSNSTGDGQALMISDFLSAEEYQSKEIYQNVFRRMDAEDQIAITIRPEEGVVIGIACNRNRRDFSERDRKILNLLRPHLVQAYTNLRRLSAQSQELETLRDTLEAIGRGVITVDSAGTVRNATPGTFDLLARYLPVSLDGKLPKEIQDWLLERENEPFRIKSEGLQLVIRQVPTRTGNALICSEEPDRSAPLSGYGLTPREREVLIWIAEGKTNAEIAAILDIASSTVKIHVERLLGKLGVENRTAAALLAHEHGLRGT